MSELGQFVTSIPPVTRTITLTSLVMGGLNSLRIIDVSGFICYFPLVFNKFEIYRLLTGFLIPNPQAMQGMMEIYMVYNFSKGIEEVKFKKNLPDYIYYFMIVLPIILGFSWLTMPPLYSLSPALLSALTFTWSVLNYYQQVNFYFMPIKASLLPAVSLGFRLLVDGYDSFCLALIGFGAAYVYNCLETRSFGPLVSLLTNKEPNGYGNNTKRLGTISTGNIWFYSTGFLEAPEWLRNIISKITGIDYENAVYRRRGFVAKKKVEQKSEFRGEGRRLGSSKS